MYILQIQNISTGFRDTSHSVNSGICKHELRFTCYSCWTFNLKFGIKQSKISQNLAEQLLRKAKISGLADDRLDNFSKDALILSCHIALSKFTGA